MVAASVVLGASMTALAQTTICLDADADGICDCDLLAAQTVCGSDATCIDQYCESHDTWDTEYTPPDLETDPNTTPPTCSPACESGGFCTSGNTCTCFAGYTGTSCETLTCDDFDGDGFCDCDLETVLVSCNNDLGCTQDVCADAGTPDLASQAAGPGDLDDINPPPDTCLPACQHGGTCSGGTCVCPVGYAGSLCECIDANDNDVCDEDECPSGDADADGICDDADTCPDDPDNDFDGDGICAPPDNCPWVPNANQLDTDKDYAGDACDLDIDSDGVANELDNCPYGFNPFQTDADADGVGDQCDEDGDDDGVIDADDACFPTSLSAVVDSEGCSIDDLAPCTPLDGEWKNHGAYVARVTFFANGFALGGLITANARDDVIAVAAISLCGAKR